MKTKVVLLSYDIQDGAVFGKRRLLEALSDKKIAVTESGSWVTEQDADTVYLAAGTLNDLRIRTLMAGSAKEAVSKPESFYCRTCSTREGTVLVLAGSDHAGLMYLLLEMARRVRLYGAKALEEAEDFDESPDNAVRCMDRYLVGHLDNEWFWSEDFWHYYLGRLAEGRFNRFSLIVGFDTPYMAPPYPFFLEQVEGYPDVRMTAFSKEFVQKNLEMLRRIVELCHSYSIQFVFATWQQRPWTQKQEVLVEGLPETESGLSEYCYAGLRALLRAVPDMDVISFRVNHESGVGTQISAEDFWNHCADAVADAKEETGKPYILDLRAKGLTEKMTAHAYERGLELEVPTKYWCEHAALPYHLSTMRSEELAQLDNFNHSRRYSYADMLQKPLRYPVIYRLWNYGSTNLFLWADSDYIRRFAKSCGLSGSAGFQVNAPLSLKYGYELSHKEAWKTFRDPALRYGTWEDERFFAWYSMFGRIGYKHDVPDEIFEEEFKEHFGVDAGAAVMRTVAEASKIVPFVTTVHMPVHPSLRYWTELNTGWALFDENCVYPSDGSDYHQHITYGSTEPSDHGLFYGIDEYVAAVSDGEKLVKYTPVQYANELFEMSRKVSESLAAAEACAHADGPEWKAFVVDMSMLVAFAAYHANKIYAAMELGFFRRHFDCTSLANALAWMKKAIDAWQKLAEMGKTYYYHDLDFSTAGTKTRRGTWADLTRELEADFESLEKLAKQNNVKMSAAVAAWPENAVQLAGVWPETVPAGEPLSIAVSAPSDAAQIPVLHYRHVDQTEGLFHEMTMQKDGDSYRATIPAEYLKGDWDLMVYVTLEAEKNTCAVYPGIYNPTYPWPYHVVRVLREEER